MTIHEMNDAEFLKDITLKAFDEVTSIEYTRVLDIALRVSHVQLDLVREREARRLVDEALKQAIEEREDALRALR